MALSLFSKPKQPKQASSATCQGEYAPAERQTLADDPLEQALQLGRLGLIVAQRAYPPPHPTFETVLRQAERRVDEQFALVPEGLVSLALTIFDQPGQPEEDVETEPLLLARHPVTNAEYQLFVDAGGYEDLELWPQDIWPHLIDLKDATGQPGPRFWKNGRHDRRLARHPVVGVCYYEALAYAAWAGYRLPTEAEWQMAASWRLRTEANTERRYPWGDGLDLTHCNIWASGHGGTLPVDACSDGAAPNGVLQLIGNTWEWTSSDFACTDREGRRVVGDSLMKSIRGGAYDTYFPWQAVASFRSGMTALSRFHNVGFRCAMAMLES